MRLEFLCLDENFIKNFNNVYVLQNLRNLFIRYNKTSDFGEVEGLQAIATLGELDMSNTPLSRKYGYRLMMFQKLPNLRILDGTVISILSRAYHLKREKSWTS